MNKIFKTVGGDNVDVVKHTLDILQKHPSVKVHIGTDSQVKENYIRYATVIAYKYDLRGVHYIVTKKRYPRNLDAWNRLWKEAEISVEVAEWLTSKINVKVEIDMDYNSDESHFSNKLIQAGKGFGESLGYIVNVKPHHNRFAVFAADKECK